jgi:hypothetical protein
MHITYYIEAEQEEEDPMEELTRQLETLAVRRDESIEEAAKEWRKWQRFTETQISFRGISFNVEESVEDLFSQSTFSMGSEEFYNRFKKHIRELITPFLETKWSWVNILHIVYERQQKDIESRLAQSVLSMAFLEELAASPSLRIYNLNVYGVSPAMSVLVRAAFNAGRFAEPVPFFAGRGDAFAYNAEQLEAAKNNWDFLKELNSARRAAIVWNLMKRSINIEISTFEAWFFHRLRTLVSEAAMDGTLELTIGSLTLKRKNPSGLSVSITRFVDEEVEHAALQPTDEVADKNADEAAFVAAVEVYAVISRGSTGLKNLMSTAERTVGEVNFEISENIWVSSSDEE